ncbi:MAG TPA: hypothetical protein VH186_10110 [Chloroflexia bacterium]|nr:hypothetical protein [Chloroflexia bacterium]
MDNPFFYLLLGLLVAWIGSYFYSIQRNRKRLREIAYWLQDALPLLGAKHTSQWRGADRLDIFVNEGRGNIREAALVGGMQSRQLFKAVISLIRGGRDSLTLLVSLQKPPASGNEFEIFEAKMPVPRTVVGASDSGNPWQIENYARSNFYKLAFRTPNAREMASRILTLLLDDGFVVRRLSTRPGAPHIMLVLNMSAAPKVEAAALLRLVKGLSDELPRSEQPGTKDRPGSRPSKSKPPSLPGKPLPKAKYSSNGFHSSNGHKGD